MASRETENNAYEKFWGDKKEHYGMLWYFLEWSVVQKLSQTFALQHRSSVGSQQIITF